VNRIIDDTGTAPGQLPLVEFTLARLWERRAAGLLTHQVYEELGGISGTLARYAEDVYENALTDTQRPRARRLLLPVGEAGGGWWFRPPAGAARRPRR